MSSAKLEMTFDPNTIEHLGVRMYSTLPPVLAELIANSYDADAKNVTLTLDDETGGKERIIIEDDGSGMTFDDINDKFLRIGRNRRIEESNQATSGGRKIIGKKGLGKLSFFGIAHEVEIDTKKNGKRNVFVMNWGKIKASGNKPYSPEVIKKDESCSDKEKGTKITLSEIQRKTDFNPKNIADSLSKIFIFDKDFTVVVKHNHDKPITINNEMKYEGLEKDFEWKIPKDLSGFNSKYPEKSEIKGLLIASKKPISPKTNMRGITLFSRKKLVNQPEYFSESISSHFFSYLTGSLEVDFIDDFKEDAISTNRQSLNWGDPGMPELREYLQDMIRWLERDWHKRRENKREKEISKNTGINLPDWFDKLPKDVRGKVQSVVNAVAKQAELDQEVSNKVVQDIHLLVPEYPRYHWRHLHPEIKKISKTYYENKNYYTAFLESVKHYINAVRSKSGKTRAIISDDTPMMENVFQTITPVLSVTDNFKKFNGDEFAPETIENIKTAHKMFSVGVVRGGRNVVAHEEVKDLRESGLFSEDDCLDALSLLSHLFRRLDNAKKITT